MVSMEKQIWYDSRARHHELYILIWLKIWKQKHLEDA